jgi:hypothetical protein
MPSASDRVQHAALPNPSPTRSPSLKRVDRTGTLLSGGRDNKFDIWIT